eukprot:TRINITY_DN1944_c0_g1_i3.p1 TRINITY_DN1944_c0_g1~~TRINITY_DN1944_c0_g1_i3.p1  ORF type:complete len:136 (+),score=41.18 TRINITY_DN1944_c0_g1_i3:230-637(+)
MIALGFAVRRAILNGEEQPLRDDGTPMNPEETVKEAEEVLQAYVVSGLAIIIFGVLGLALAGILRRALVVCDEEDFAPQKPPQDVFSPQSPPEDIYGKPPPLPQATSPAGIDPIYDKPPEDSYEKTPKMDFQVHN